MESTADRIRKARQSAGLTQAQLGAACNVTREAASQWEARDPKKRTTPSLENFNKISMATGYASWWLQSGEGPTLRQTAYHVNAGTERKRLDVRDVAGHAYSTDMYTLIPWYERSPAAEGGSIEQESVESPLAFHTDWLMSCPLSISDLALMHAEGESMEPTISNGDILLIDCSQRQIRSGKVYALRIGEDVRAKRLFWQTDGSLLISSDNKSPDHRDETVPPASIGNVHVIGRVIWAGGKI